MIEEIPISKLVPNNYNPRKHFDDAKMKELEGSIKGQGLIQAITVRPIDGGKYEVVAGIRRLMASKKAGLKKLPALIRDLTDEEAKLLSITENLERSNLTPIEEARAFQDYLGWDEQVHFEGKRQAGTERSLVTLAESLPLSESTMKYRLSLLHLPESLQTRVEQDTLGIKIAQVIVRLKDLWEIKTSAFNDEEIEQNKESIKADIHQVMEHIAKTVETEDQARTRVNDYIETEKMNLEQREAMAGKLKTSLEDAETKLIELLTKFEIPPNWGEMDMDEKVEWVNLHIESNIKKLSDERLGEISKERALKSSQQDRFMMNLTYVKNSALDLCPHCGAGINIGYLERRINELQDEIKELGEAEGVASDDLKVWRNNERTLKNLQREYDSRLVAYNESIKKKDNDD